MTSNSKYSNDLPHTKVTDEILKVIDEGDSNRYQVALRLTQYVEQTHTNTIKTALEVLLSEKQTIDTEHNYEVNTFNKGVNHAVKQATANLKALIGGDNE